MLGDLGQPYPPFSRTSSEFWFDDGSIIIVCGDTGYRVHKGVLAFNSAVFKDMFAHGDADPSCNEMLDGCVVVRLDDESDDMLKLLRALYSRKWVLMLFLPPPDILKTRCRFARGKTVITFELLNSLLKLSTKYAFDELRSELVEHLILMFPSERADYAQDKARTILPADYDPAIAVEFGISYNIPAITPTACFEVALWSLPKLLDEGSGFIHLSTAPQVSNTLKWFFADEPGVYVLRIAYDGVEKDIRWEDPKAEVCGPRGGEGMFPHLYNGLKLGKNEVESVVFWKNEGGFDEALQKAEGWLVY
ncbi:hypothetical protein EWM64_g4085 [Hericium alpestre]|uniref:BTB domain-containing protein n=1 Tax=Hericium alpestre TaxID=135208 RepID=A0A4Y9ZYF6_9AGAM|nr:hypothetical protein EWM64_g4085 [Hericium alpestre]